MNLFRLTFKARTSLLAAAATLVVPAAAAWVVIGAVLGPAAHAQVAERPAPTVTVVGTGFSIETLKSGATAFANRTYTWAMVPKQFDGWQFTQTLGGLKAQIAIQDGTDGFVYLATDSTTPQLAGGIVGWELQAGQTLTLTDHKHTVYSVYRAPYHAGTTLAIPQIGWSGGILLAPSLAAPALAVAAQPASAPPGVVIDYLPAASHRFIGSPALAILPDGSYVAAHDIFFGATDGNHTRLFRSTDRGATWQAGPELIGQYWSNLFVNRGALYLLGTSGGFGHITLRRSLDGGQTWTSPSDTLSGLITNQSGVSCAPTPVVEAKGRLWKAFEINPPGARGRQFQAFVLSAPADADLLRADSWTPTNSLPYVVQETGGNWLEGNAVIAPDGNVVDILRISKTGLEKAALLHVSPDGRHISWDPQADLIDFPGGGVKFTIRFDPVSHRYWSLVNKQRNPDALRNVLALVSSSDLRHWTVERTLLQHPDKRNHAFQYVDWQFDGSDIIAVSRTSWDGDTYHNANYLTFHRFPNFRAVLHSPQPE